MGTPPPVRVGARRTRAPRSRGLRAQIGSPSLILLPDAILSPGASSQTLARGANIARNDHPAVTMEVRADTSLMPPKPKTAFVCQQCGNDYPKWIGKCPSCGGWNTLVEERIVAPPKGRSGDARAPRAPVALNEVPPDAEVRIPTGIAEFDRVLGGGIVRGSLVLLGGDPAIGKSSLLMQASASLSERGTVLYVSGEESAAQVKLRARRFGIDGGNILLLGETDLASVIEAIRRTKPL